MRELTNSELEMVCGGLDPNEDIVVTGIIPPIYFPDDMFASYLPPAPLEPPTGVASQPAYGSSGTGAAATTAATLLAAHGSLGAVNHSSNHTPAADKAISDIKASLLDEMTKAIGSGAGAFMPDGTQVTASTLEDFISRIQFEAVDATFGDGRAGANTIGADGIWHVQINVGQLISYDNLAGGINYLVDHEIAHDSPGGQLESAAMWNAYLGEPGVAAMTAAQQAANYPNSTEFVTNEQWANSGALAIANLLGVTMLANPTNGFYTPPPPPPPPAGGGGGGGHGGGQVSSF